MSDDRLTSAAVGTGTVGEVAVLRSGRPAVPAVAAADTPPAPVGSSARGAFPVLLDLVAPVLLSVAAAHELHYNDAAWPSWVLAALVIWPLVWRRRAPVLVLGVCLVGALLLWGLHVASVADAALLVALYTVTAHRDLRQALVAALALEAGVVLVAFRFAPPGSVGDVVILLSSSVAAALFLGTTVRVNRAYLATLEDRARRLEREQAQQAELAAAAERTRIAREMHDVVAHGLSVVITLAEGAAASAATDPAATRDAMRQVAGAGRQSLAEMRKLLDVLRTGPGADRAPQPDLAMLDGLVEDVRSTGLDVRLDRSGDPTELGLTVQATVYRVVQEALTNVIRHARGASVVVVDLHCNADQVRFTIADDGRSSSTGASTPGGNGLVGMRERVAMFGGRLEAGPSATGWVVRGELRVAEARACP